MVVSACRYNTTMRPARVTVTLFAVLAVALAAALLVASFASYATVKHRLDRFASDGDANLSRDRFDTIVVQVRIAAALLLVAGGGIQWRRRGLAGRLDELARSVAAESVRALGSARRAL